MRNFHLLLSATRFYRARSLARKKEATHATKRTDLHYLNLFEVVLLVVLLSGASCRAQETKFSTEVWMQKALKPHSMEFMNRYPEFRLFLKDYNLIGMRRAEVIRLLGIPDREAGYLLRAGSDSLTELEIDYANDTVTRWRLNGFNSKGFWHDEDLVAGPDGKGFIPKEKSGSHD